MTKTPLFGKLPSATLDRRVAGRMVLDSALTGAVFDGGFRPVSADKAFLQERVCNAVTGAATFGTLTASMLGIRAFVPNASLGRMLRGDIGSALVSGVPAGIVNAELASIFAGKGRAKPTELVESIYTFSIVGGGLAVAKRTTGYPAGEGLAERTKQANGKQDLSGPVNHSQARIAGTDAITAGNASEGLALLSRTAATENGNRVRGRSELAMFDPVDRADGGEPSTRCAHEGQSEAKHTSKIQTGTERTGSIPECQTQPEPRVVSSPGHHNIHNERVVITGKDTRALIVRSTAAVAEGADVTAIESTVSATGNGVRVGLSRRSTGTISDGAVADVSQRSTAVIRNARATFGTEAGGELRGCSEAVIEQGAGVVSLHDQSAAKVIRKGTYRDVPTVELFDRSTAVVEYRAEVNAFDNATVSLVEGAEARVFLEGATAKVHEANIQVRGTGGIFSTGRSSKINVESGSNIVIHLLQGSPEVEVAPGAKVRIIQYTGDAALAKGDKPIIERASATTEGLPPEHRQRYFLADALRSLETTDAWLKLPVNERRDVRAIRRLLEAVTLPEPVSRIQPLLGEVHDLCHMRVKDPHNLLVKLIDAAVENPYLRSFERAAAESTQVQLRLHPILAQRYAFAVPTSEALAIMARYSPLVEVGAGTGYWAGLLRQIGVNIKAFDQAPVVVGSYNEYHPQAKSFTEVLPGDATIASRFPRRTLVLCWPPPDSPMASDALRSYQGKRLIFIGEGFSGCTADGPFFETLAEAWRPTAGGEVRLPNWIGIRDSMQVFRRKTN